MIVALLALFVALGGSSYAALKIGSPQIRNNSVLSVDLHDNTVRGADVRRNTLTGADIKESTLAQGARGGGRGHRARRRSRAPMRWSTRPGSSTPGSPAGSRART